MLQASFFGPRHIIHDPLGPRVQMGMVVCVFSFVEVGSCQKRRHRVHILRGYFNKVSYIGYKSTYLCGTDFEAIAEPGKGDIEGIFVASDLMKLQEAV